MTDTLVITRTRTRTLTITAQGPQGIQGPVVPGGDTGQVLTKASADDGDVIWEDPAGGLSLSADEGQQATLGTDGGILVSGLAGAADLGTAAALDAPATGNAGTTEVVLGSDTRLTDSRTPSSHTHAQSDVTDLTTALTGKVGTGDSRLTDARTPTAHASSHGSAGSDPLGAAGIPSFAAIVAPGETGRYGAYSGTSTATMTMTEGAPVAGAVFIPAGSIDRLGIEVVAAGGTGSVVRLGIYTCAASGMPGTLVVDAGTVDGTSASAQEITLSPATALAGGVYWVVAVGQGAAASRPILRGRSNGGVGQSGRPALPSGTSIVTTSGLVYVSGGTTTGALPSSGGDLGLLRSTNSGPMIGWRRA